MKGPLSILSAGIFCLSLQYSTAATLHNEAIDGDFSNNYLTPTLLTLNLGNNEVKGQLAGRTRDLDLFTLTVPAGLFISELRITEFTGGGAGSFIGLQPRSILSNSPFEYLRASTGEISFVGIEEINNGLITPASAMDNDDLLPQLVIGAPLSGLSPLPSGDYAFWLNETGAASTYGLDLIVIPEPSSTSMLLIGSCAILLRRKKPLKK